MSSKRVYFDNYAMMLPTPEHLAKVMELLSRCAGNPSNTHWAGRRAKVMLEKSRESVAYLLGAHRSQVVFVSGATEANYLVLWSVLKACAGENKGCQSKIFLSAAEHSSHYQNAKKLACELHMDYQEIPLQVSGEIDEAALREALHEKPVYVGIFYVNHETGIKNRIKDMCLLIKDISPNTHIHVDAAQALGKEDLGYIASSLVDSLAVSSAKIGGLSGTGAVYIKDPGLLDHYMSGGSQERGLRPGTENLAGIFSFAQRCEFVRENPHWLDHTRELFGFLHSSLSSLAEVNLHGDMRYSSRLALSFCLREKSAAFVQTVMEKHGIAIGYGSACSREPFAESKVLLAMGVETWQAKNSLRVSLGPNETQEEVEMFLGIISCM